MKAIKYFLVMLPAIIFIALTPRMVGSISWEEYGILKKIAAGDASVLLEYKKIFEMVANGKISDAQEIVVNINIFLWTVIGIAILFLFIFIIADVGSCIGAWAEKEDEQRVNNAKTTTPKENNQDAIKTTDINEDNQNNISAKADEIIKFKKLLDDGAITQEEYNRIKSKILI